MSKFLPEDFGEFCTALYGENFEGELRLFNGKSKKSQGFDNASMNALSRAIQQDYMSADLYLGLATQEAGLPVNKRGGSETAVMLPGFFADIDFASEKDSKKNYPHDAKVAKKKLDSFVFKPSFIQNSGNGYHVFWSFSNPVDLLDPVRREVAIAVSKAFQKMLQDHFKKHGNEIDNVGDLARIFRVPGSMNHKGNEPKAVETVLFKPSNRIDFDAIALMLNSEQSAEAPKKRNDKAYPPADFERIQGKCKWFERYTKKDAASCDEPNWNAIASIAAACVDGEQHFTTASQPHPDFKEREAKAKFSRAKKSAAPRTCKSICEELGNDGICNGCSYFGKIKSPVQLGHASYVEKAANELANLAEDEWPEVTKFGKPIKSLLNALIACARAGVVFEYDRFHNRLRIGGHVLQVYQGDLSDKAVAKLHSIIIQTFGFDPGRGHLHDAVHMLCIESQFHPVHDYLDGLKWDNTPRVETWLIDFMGAEDTPLNRAAGKMVLVAAVRRVRKPGIKYDTMIVFEGIQGSGKSTAIYILAGEGNFSDQALLGIDEKAQMEALEGVWFYEIAELDGMSRAETSKIKASLSRTVDQGRPAYGRYKESWPRQCVFIATTNEDFYLKDQTGNRRFLPVKTGRIDLEGLAQMRDQLFAEANQLEATGFPIELPTKLWADAETVQNERMQEDPWLDLLSKISGTVKGGFERIHTETIFGQDFLSIPSASRKPHHMKQAAITMRKIGWVGPKKLRVNGVVGRGYERPSDKPDNLEL